VSEYCCRGSGNPHHATCRGDLAGPIGFPFKWRLFQDGRTRLSNGKTWSGGMALDENFVSNCGVSRRARTDTASFSFLILRTT